ncbi:hypothetical protein THAOC_13012, partial [Thalassiosira oceanica]
MDFALLPEYFGGSFDIEYAKKLVVEAFEEDTGLKVGSGVAKSGEEEEDEDHQVEEPGTDILVVVVDLKASL